MDRVACIQDYLKHISNNTFNGDKDDQYNRWDEPMQLFARKPRVFVRRKTEEVPEVAGNGNKPRNGQSRRRRENQEKWEMMQNRDAHDAN